MKRDPRKLITELTSDFLPRKEHVLVLGLLGDWHIRVYESHAKKPDPDPKYYKARRRLVVSIDALISGKPIPKKDRDWLGLVLCDVLYGKDVGAIFTPPRTRARGRKIESDDHKCMIALDSLIESEKTGAAGKTLWGKLSKKWGYPDGSIKNFITQYREKAEWLRKCGGLSDEDWESLISGWKAKVGKSQ